MFLTRVTLAFGIIANCLAIAPAVSQQPMASGRGNDSAEALRAYGIEISRSSLLAALGNGNAKVRVLAAYQLAAERDADAVSDIEVAYSHEQDPISRVGLATALSSLGDRKGDGYLAAICADPASSVIVKIRSIQMLETLKAPIDQCAQPALNALNDSADAAYRDAIISVLVNMYDANAPNRSKRILNSMERLLVDQNQQPNVRLAAGNALSEIGSASSIPILEDAYSKETDPVIRESLRSNIGTVERKQQSTVQ